MNRFPIYKAVYITFFALLSILFLIGCSSNTEESAIQNVGDKNAIKIIDHAERTLFFSKPPERIVSLVQADMEIIHALGGSIVGRPTVQGEIIPKELSNVTEVGNVHDIDFEKVVSLKPDLVIGNAGINIKDVASLEALGLQVILTKGNSFEANVEMIEMYGDMLERQLQAKQLIENLESQKAVLEPLNDEVKALIVFGSTESFMAALPTSLSGNLLEIAGGTNIAAGLPGIERYPEYAQLSMERVLQQNPDVIFFIAHGEPEAVRDKFEAELKSNAAWSNLNALKNNRLIILPPELFSSNPGPRVVEAIEFIYDRLKEIDEK